MKNISIFCLTLDPDHEDIIKKLEYIPVGLGNKKFSKECLSDKRGLNISEKNSNYGEYTFHYWIWKNYLENIKTEWVGFCQYRKFFITKNISDININLEDFKNSLLKEIDYESSELFDCILGEKLLVDDYKISKIYKNYLSTFLLNPTLLFNKKKRNLKLHFDLYHGKGNLELAIDLLDEGNKNDFRLYMNENNSFHPQNMFICKTKILKNYYNVVFPWLFKCEKIFKSKNLYGYGLKRLYGFLAERFLSYWFTKNHTIKVIPIFGKDLSDYK